MRLGIAQPALSQQVRALEEEIGVRLLDRNRRRVELTSAGAAFLERARLTLAQAADAVRAAQEADRGEAGHLAVGFVASSLYGLFPDIVRVFRSRYPKVQLRLQETPVSQQGEMLRSGRIDVGILRPPIDAEGLVVRTILHEPWVVALPSTHAAAADRKVDLRSLRRDSFICFPRSLAPNVYDNIVSTCRQAGFSPNIVLEAQMQATVSLVAAGMGVALLPESMQNLRRKGVIYRSLREPVPRVALGVAWKEDMDTPVLRSFLKVVEEVARKNSL